MENNDIISTDTNFKMLEPKDIELNGKKFTISKFPAFDGYEIMIRYIPVHFANLNGDFNKIKEMVLKVMKYVAVILPDGRKVRLETEDLINNHLSNGEEIMELVAQIMDYNTSFFKNGKGSTFFGRLENLATQKVTEILTLFADNLLQKTKQPSGN